MPPEAAADADEDAAASWLHLNSSVRFGSSLEISGYSRRASPYAWKADSVKFKSPVVSRSNMQLSKKLSVRPRQTLSAPLRSKAPCQCGGESEGGRGRVGGGGGGTDERNSLPASQSN